MDTGRTENEAPRTTAAYYTDLKSALAPARLRLRRRRDDRQLELHRPSVAQHLDGRRRSDLRVGNHLREVRRIVDRLAVEGDDDVARLDTGLKRFGGARHARHE